MSGREFFLNRYEQLGWKYRPIKLRQAIRFNQTNIKEGTDLVERLADLGVGLEKIDFCLKAIGF
jgi:hypothetical protein